MSWIQNHLLLFSSLVALAAGIWWMLPSRAQRPNLVGLLLSLAGLIALSMTFHKPEAAVVSHSLFWLFGGGAVLCSILMICSRKPVYGALWFALATLSTCGLFLLQSAPFLAATTIIVYAGAIIVTFLFVMMLAQQSGVSIYDQRTRQPLLATATAFVLLGALLTTLHDWAKPAANAPVPAANVFSRQSADQPLGTMHGLGRSLFGDYLFAVELGGTVLLIACIGAIAIAPRKRQGTL
ncbi:NADH-quinone oxidoreductase subunit J family protein [Planctomicrobium sp. SH664]|uniref:NADH-quinone oxidoreductase subunit J family protein n=1 Tax=Planctomicrobium sp. SH664 TaxID=3448125 RepID=UPI003F5C8503